MLSSHCSHYNPAGIARRRLWPGWTRAWPNLAIFPFYLFFSPPTTALRGVLSGRITALPSRRTLRARPTMHNTNTTPLTAEHAGVSSRGYTL